MEQSNHRGLVQTIQVWLCLTCFFQIQLVLQLVLFPFADVNAEKMEKPQELSHQNEPCALKTREDWLSEVTFGPIIKTFASGSCRHKLVWEFAGRVFPTGALWHQQSSPSPIIWERYSYLPCLPMPCPWHTPENTPELFSHGAAWRRTQQVHTNVHQSRLAYKAAFLKQKHNYKYRLFTIYTNAWVSLSHLNWVFQDEDSVLGALGTAPSWCH